MKTLIAWSDGGISNERGRRGERGMYGSWLIEGGTIKTRDFRKTIHGEAPKVVSNNVAEYMALLCLMGQIKDRWVKGVRYIIRVDSRLVKEQVEGNWRVKAKHLLPLRNAVRRMISNVKESLDVEIEFEHIKGAEMKKILGH